MTRPLDPAIIAREIDNLLAAVPELADDETLRHDMIEAETSAFELLSRIVRRIGESKANQAGLQEYEKELKERRARFERREDGLRTLAEKIMDAANLRKCELPEATLSIGNGRPKVIITDESIIPDSFVEIERKPKKKEIGDALKAKQDVPGCVLSNAESVFSIRTR